MAVRRGDDAPRLVAGNAHPALAEQLAAELGIEAIVAEVDRFADGEIRLHVPGDVEGRRVLLVQPTCPPVTEHLMALLLLVDAIRAAGAAQVTAVVPYFGYARQEMRAHSGDPRSAGVVARQLNAIGLDGLVTLDIHAPALESALAMPVTLLDAREVFLPIVESWGLDAPVMVAPDAGGLKRAQRFATQLGTDVAVIAKTRKGPDVATPLKVLGEVRDRDCVVVDDLASTGRTLAGAADVLTACGARQVHAVVTHAVMAPGARERLSAAPFGRLVTTDSIPVAAGPRLQVVSIAPLLAKVLAWA